jgi:pimeloyl-ACP methyl ester carboxylesterase
MTGGKVIGRLTARSTRPDNRRAMNAPFSTFISAPDGMRIHVRNHGQRSQMALPVVCLPGLARTTADFEALATALAPDRRVIALDYRGRGLSLLNSPTCLRW